MAEEDHVLVEKRGRVQRVTLNRPEAKNALTPSMVTALGSAFENAEKDQEIGAILITGAGQCFCAGADMKAIGGGDEPAANVKAFMEIASPIFDGIERMRLPVIAAVQGFALAGGLELLLCCDLVVADESAKIGDSHANFGLVPGGGSALRLTQRLGPLRARELLFTGDHVSADQMLAMGLVNKVVPTGQLENCAQELAEKIAAKSPLAVAVMKQMVFNALALPPRDCLDLEAQMCVEHAGSEDALEGLRAFAERRSPNFVGR